MEAKMFIVYEWNWGWYKTEFKNRADADFYLAQCADVARMSIRPAPYMIDSKGNRIDIMGG